METNWAAEHLQTIRTLMERSALYRRALAPVMLLVGGLGSVAAAVGLLVHLESDMAFIELWGATSFAALGGAFLLIRKQALGAAEPFWTPPTRRVGGAIAPPLVFGMVITLLFIGPAAGYGAAPKLLPAIWMALYGCALHAAGFFMPRGIKWLGWLFIAAGSGLLLLGFGADVPVFGRKADGCHLAMGAAFGGLHLTYGIYLYFTEQRKNVA